VPKRKSQPASPAGDARGPSASRPPTRSPLLPRTLRVILLDDTATALLRCARLLGDQFLVQHATSLDQIAALGPGDAPDCFLVDLILAGGEPEPGFAAIACIRQRFPNVPIVVWSKMSEPYIARAVKLGASCGVRKYIDDDRLKAIVCQVVEWEVTRAL